jgi:N-acetylglucosamine kinase-like BadF-type ATPase
VLLAVDGGASKTEVVIVAEDGSLLGRARGEASNHQLVGVDGAVESIAATVKAAMSGLGGANGAGANGARVCALGVYCLAGLDLPIDEERLSTALRLAGWTTDQLLYNDTFAVFRSGARSGRGVGVVCGTGLNCVGLGPGGTTVRFPALGELSGDFAPGGIWLGIRGLGLALRAGDGRGASTVLRRLVAEHFHLPSPEAVLEAVYSGSIQMGRLAELAPTVLLAADEGDGPAGRAVSYLVDEVVAMAVATVDRLEGDPRPAAASSSAGSVPPDLDVVVGGGLFHHEGFAQAVLDGIRRHSPGASLAGIAGPPVLGAALLGLDHLDAGPSAEARLRSQLV